VTDGCGTVHGYAYQAPRLRLASDITIRMLRLWNVRQMNDHARMVARVLRGRGL
jgi:hypothetical protein